MNPGHKVAVTLVHDGVALAASTGVYIARTSAKLYKQKVGWIEIAVGAG